MISLDNLTVSYGGWTLFDGISFLINEKDRIGLVGKNGAGKTTTIKMLSCLAKPTEGNAYLLGKSITTEDSEIKAFIGVSPQETAIAQGLTVKENLDLICGIYGYTKEQKNAKINELLTLLSLNSVENKKASKLSGGYQRRLSIAIALVSEPKILFLDEPTLGLDVIARSELWDIIKSLKTKSTIILTTHYMEEAEELSDRVAIMKDGKLLECDTVSAIKEKANAPTLEGAFIKIVKGEVK